MRRVLATLLALCVGLVLAVPAQVEAQDDELERLLQLRQATLEELTDVSLRAAEVELRQGSPDWIAVRTDDGSVVQVGMDRIDELVPWVRMALADRDAAPALWAALGRHVPKAALAAYAPSFLVLEEWAPYVEGLRSLRDGRLEDVDADTIRELFRLAFANEAVRAKLDVDANYRALGDELEEQREALHVVLQVLDADIEARGGTVPAGPIATSAPSLPPTEIEELPTPTPEPSTILPPSSPPSPGPRLTPEPTPGQESEGVQYDALEGLTECDTADPDCVRATPGPCGEADMWCQDPDAGGTAAPLPADGADAVGADSTTAPEPAPTTEPDPAEELVDAFSLWDGCWATPWGRLRLDEDTGGHVSGTLVWFDADGERRARLELDPLIGDYPDRLVGTLLDGPPTQAVACGTASDGTLQWARGRIDYTMSGRTFAGSFIPCDDYDGFGSLPLTGTWEATLEECTIAP